MSSVDSDPVAEHLRSGEEALARGAWEDARSAFSAALTKGEVPQALEGLGWAAFWLEDAPTSIDARERAYRLYRERGDARGAARVAIWLAIDSFTFRGEPAVASGWLRRAERLLSDVPVSPEHGWLALYEGHFALMFHHDTSSARRAGTRMTEIGRAVGSLDIEMAGLALGGLARVTEGDVAAGMEHLDEATAAAVGGELRDLVAVWSACCYLIYACERVRDYQRAAQWCERVEEFCRRWSLRHMFSVCRTHYAGVLIWEGAWEEAERELAASIDDLTRTRPAVSAEAIVRLAELRRRQQRLEEAEELLKQVEAHPLACLGQAGLALQKGDPVTATDLAQRFLRRIPPEDLTDRAGALELLVRAHLALGQVDVARSRVDELVALADAVGTPALAASAVLARGLLAAASDDEEGAQTSFEDALDLFRTTSARLEQALTRVELAACLRRRGRSESAAKEEAAAASLLRSLGVHEADTAPEVPAGSGRREERPAGLSAREIEVLQLVAEGLTNPEIAARLVLSEHTVRRHVAAILTKLGVPSRTAAASAAHRLDLL